MTRLWKRADEPKEATIENVPEEIIKKVLSWAIIYEKCGECGTEQFLYFRPGYNTTGTCKNCGAEDTI